MEQNELYQRIESNTAPLIVDPRTGSEFKKGHIPGAVNAPVGKILLNHAGLPEEKDCEMVIACMHGQRAVVAKWILERYGYSNMDLLDGYIKAWKAAGLPLETNGNHEASRQ
jgi:rhodanese-related sulfurtransferase